MEKSGSDGMGGRDEASVQMSFEALENYFEPTKLGTPDTNNTCRLLSLPREIRDIIYYLVLVPPTPIELAPIVSHCNPVEIDERSRTRDWFGLIQNDQVHWQMWHCVYKPSLSLLRTCRQIRHEGSSAFYGQPFRFTSRTGWVVMYAWLDNIGARNRCLVRDVTVCHPAMTYNIETNRDFITAHFEEHCLDWFGLKLPYSDFFWLPDECDEWCNMDPLVKLDVDSCWPGWGNFPHPAFLLAEMKSLHQLRLLVRPRLMDSSGPEYRFGLLKGHPIYRLLKSELPNTKLSIVNFIQSDEKQFAIANMSKLVDDENKSTYQEATDFFEGVSGKGWHVEELMYDNYNNYPVSLGEECQQNHLMDWVDDQRAEMMWNWSWPSEFSDEDLRRIKPGNVHYLWAQEMLDWSEREDGLDEFY